MGPESLAAAAIVKFTGVVPSVTRGTALVMHPDGAVFACACTRLTMMALSRVQDSPVQAEDKDPGKNVVNGPRGLAETDSVPIASPEENFCSCD